MWERSVRTERRAGFRRIGVSHWTFLTNHASVLFCVASNPNLRIRDISTQVGITERAAHRIVAELEDAGYLERKREGRRNVYQLHTSMPLRHPREEGLRIADLLALADSAPDSLDAGTPGDAR